MNNIPRKKSLTTILVCIGLSANVTYSSTPSEMASLSLDDLLSLSVDDSTEQTKLTSPWAFSLNYRQMRLDGYKRNTNDLSFDEVLFTPGETRTNENFPVVPTEITQEAIVASLHYSVDSKSSIVVSLPYIKQGTDHISSVDSYENFLIISEGIGDLSGNYSRLFKRWEQQTLTWSLGLSAPTGSIDKKGDTPRAAGDQQLPYTMQLGSGTWDFTLGLGYQNTLPTWTWGSSISTKIRTGKNDRSYRLGDRLTASVWGKWRNQHQIKPLAKLHLTHWEAIKGQDDEITVPNPSFPYPAAITNPSYFGGEKASLALGLETSIGKQIVTFEVGLPVYQNLNGVQNDEKINFSVNWDIPTQ